MTIKSHIGPPTGRTVMQQALLQRLPRIQQFSTPTGGGMQTGSPIPVYLLEPNRLTNPIPLDSATLTSWRYPVVGGQQPGLAEIRERTSGGTDFAGLSRGLLSRRVFEASVLAENALALNSAIYEPRLLEVPALQFVALWLVTGADQRFIPLLEGTPPGSAPLMMVDDVIPLLKTRAAVVPTSVFSVAPGIVGPTN